MSPTPEHFDAATEAASAAWLVFAGGAKVRSDVAEARVATQPAKAIRAPV